MSRTVHYSNHKFLGAFSFRSCKFLFDICTRTSSQPRSQGLSSYEVGVPEGFPCLRKRFSPVFGISQAVSLEGMCRAFKK